MDIGKLRSMGLVGDIRPLLEREFTVQYRPLLPEEQWKVVGVEERQEAYESGTIQVFIRKPNAFDEVMMTANAAKGIDPAYTLFHRCTFNAKGERVFPKVEDALGMNLVMFSPLLMLFSEIQGDPLKKSLPRMRRGASSPLPSAAEPSKSSSTESAAKSGEPGSSTESNTAP